MLSNKAIIPSFNYCCGQRQFVAIVTAKVLYAQKKKVTNFYLLLKFYLNKEKE